MKHKNEETAFNRSCAALELLDRVLLTYTVGVLRPTNASNRHSIPALDCALRANQWFCSVRKYGHMCALVPLCCEIQAQQDLRKKSLSF